MCVDHVAITDTKLPVPVTHTVPKIVSRHNYAQGVYLDRFALSPLRPQVPCTHARILLAVYTRVPSCQPQCVLEQKTI